MKKRLRFILATAVLCAVLGGCGGSAKELVIELEENPTTGYQWSYVMQPEGILTEISSEYLKPDTKLTGAGGTRQWKFAAAADGDVTLTFTYRRVWETPAASDKTVTCTYRVSGGKITEKK